MGSLIKLEILFNEVASAHIIEIQQAFGLQEPKAVIGLALRFLEQIYTLIGNSSLQDQEEREVVIKLEGATLKIRISKMLVAVPTDGQGEN